MKFRSQSRFENPCHQGLGVFHSTYSEQIVCSNYIRYALKYAVSSMLIHKAI